jgi:5'-3' exoribonuclease 1
MGVPKFYRWLSERYPLINQAIDDTTLLPEFDNLYLDMNGIIHNATHGNDGVSKTPTDKDMILTMMAYIDRMVKIIKPRKLLYMAIDGVAPRAKMNQQRSRRFRAARDLAEARATAAARGEEVTDEEVFDSNCITPGTPFMATISTNLKYFIQKKLKEDPVWQRFKVIFSGHEVRARSPTFPQNVAA